MEDRKTKLLRNPLGGGREAGGEAELDGNGRAGAGLGRQVGNRKALGPGSWMDMKTEMRNQQGMDYIVTR